VVRIFMPGRPSATAALLLAAAGSLLSAAYMASARPPAPASLPYRSPYAAAFSPDGKLLAVTDRTAGSLALFDSATGRMIRHVGLSEPAGLAWDARGRRVFVAEYGAGAVAEIDPGDGKVVRRTAVAPMPVGLALSEPRRLIVAACAGLHIVSIVDLRSGRERARIACSGEPFGAAIVPGRDLAAVGMLVPGLPSSDPAVSSSITLIDLRICRTVAAIRLPAGSSMVRGIAASPDGRWIYAVHTLGKHNLPTTQADRGWINTNALSIIDVAGRTVYATLLLDSIFDGAADPWGIALSRDGGTMWITLAGCRQLARIDLSRLHAYLAGDIPDTSPLLRPPPEYAATSLSSWARIKRDPKQRDLLSTDLSALYAADLLTRADLPGIGPRGLALSPDGKRLAVAMYFSGAIQMVDPATGSVTGSLSMGPARPDDAARVGERMFHDGSLCFQHWLSCSTCHPDGRADGMNWDLLNDGIGNPKNTRSLLYAHRRSPVMSQGVRSSMHVAVLAGFRFIEFREPSTEETSAVEAFIASMRPRRSPYRIASGALSPSAARGKALFESPRTRCAACHAGPDFTDQRLHDVGTRNDLDNTSAFVTSTLIEVWRTAPYLHDGRAATMHDLLTRCNPGDRHGVTSHLTSRQIDDLSAYVLSL
jgi:DNA-binding beta-propeller fold protein YncE